VNVLIGYSRCPHTYAAFANRGHNVWTCDLLPAIDPYQKHFTGDVWTITSRPWDLAIFHPMCTYLTVSGAWAFTDGPYHQKVRPETLVGAARREARERELDNFKKLLALPYPKAIENPAPSFISKAIRPPDQTIQPYDFGEDMSKRTGLWLDRLPLLKRTNRVAGRWVGGKERWSNQTDAGDNRLPPSADRWLLRSKTPPGIATAMGEQWG
jgi:hypothetical protein